MSVEVTRLPSGLTIATDAMSHLGTASLGVWVGSGSRDERPDEHGISHLLEHMAFKGTTRRTARQIAEEILADGRLSWEEVLQIVLAVRGGSSVVALAPEMGIPAGTRAVIRAKPKLVPA